MKDLVNLILLMAQDIRMLKACLRIIDHVLLEKQQKEWIDDQQVQQRFGISQRKLQYLRSKGALPFTRMGRKTFYRMQDVERLLEKNK